MLLWAVRDDAPEPEGYRFRDAQCGVFASSKVLSRFDIPFDYLTNCYTEDVKFENGIRNFLAAAGVKGVEYRQDQADQRETRRFLVG